MTEFEITLSDVLNAIEANHIAAFEGFFDLPESDEILCILESLYPRHYGVIITWMHYELF